MSKWTKDPSDLKKISEFSQQINGVTIVEVTLESGQILEGAVRSMSVGNNASAALNNGNWLYFGNFDIEMLDGRRFNIDMCDVKLTRNVWNQRRAAYEEAGLIKIVGR